MKLLVFLCIFLTLTCCSNHYEPHSRNLRLAEQYSRQGDYDAAITAYRAHLNDRLEITDRPAWENPYFYEILIGDIELGRNNPQAAEKEYQAASLHGVDLFLVSDRLRQLAAWYEQRGELQRAFDILNAARDKDPLMFDAMLDRISKELVAKELESRSASPAIKAGAEPKITRQPGKSALAR